MHRRQCGDEAIDSVLIENNGVTSVIVELLRVNSDAWCKRALNIPGGKSN